MKLQSRADAARRWWRALGPQNFDNGYKTPGDRATLARLRRCSNVFEAAVEPATGKLFQVLDFDRTSDRHLGKAAALASVLAHVREDNSRRIAIAIGAPSGGDAKDVLFKPNRFRALMAARSDDEILTSFRRVVALMGRTANVHNLAELIIGWTDDEDGDRLRTRFAFEYHGAASYAPSINDISDLDKKD